MVNVGHFRKRPPFEARSHNTCPPNYFKKEYVKANTNGFFLQAFEVLKFFVQPLLDDDRVLELSYLTTH